MDRAPELLLVGAVAAVGVLHTMVPDHWLPIAVIARQRRWSKAQTARAAFQAGIGHVLSTLAIALVVWVAGVGVAARFGTAVDAASSLALIAFGVWIAIAALREGGHAHAHDHDHDHDHDHGDHPTDHEHDQKTRTALVLILGSSPMVEGIPAFFAAGKYGARLVSVMAVVFSASTIATYVLLCIFSRASLERLRWARFERYGELWSGLLIALVGVAFGLWSVL